MLFRIRFALCSLPLLAVFTGCEDPESLKIHHELPENIQYVKLNKSLFGQTPTLVANGRNSLSFYIEYFDKDMNKLTFNAGTKLKVLVNTGAVLNYPYKFITSTPGNYTFRIDGIRPGAVTGPEISVTAIADETFGPVTLPVVFHYIVPQGIVVSEGVLQDIRNTMTYNLAAANKAFADQYSSFDPNRVPLFVSFTPATHDPDGVALERAGLHVVQASETSFEDPDDPQLQALIWNGNFWPPKEYLNVWVIPMDSKYSYGKFPVGGGSGQFPNFAYGVYFNQKHYANVDSHVLTHEFGHLLNLYHVFDNSCSPDPDLCTDTNAYSRDYSADYDGGLEKVDCDGLSFVSSNYMDYYPSKNNTFTFQQRRRIWNTINNYAFLPTPRNQSPPGGGRQDLQRRSTLSMPRIDSRNLTVY
jgi:hypothetical protein